MKKKLELLKTETTKCKSNQKEQKQRKERARPKFNTNKLTKQRAEKNPI